MDVLVVDNDPLVRLGTVVMLRDIGYEPTAAADPAHAVEIAKGENAPAILVTDYSMPDMTGIELAHAVQAAQPDTRVLIVTGHDHLPETLEDSWGLLAKPFTSMELREALDALQPSGR